ncbi:integrase [Desulfobacter hydrogenophilus]|uniref:Integrase n=1 Tax=Desulfobacter hydrogenophilus TaxID=2291 RepID=A0A328FCU6_9BACT|nr:tyrosine-type recombinase/integrase [Desulfobacter hydrogenophilus]NDY73038.1 tyrosine-type recombinase/integrase [Desulfobacter hydrogenophilus]QBH14711.1 integrase [Desulfobacter hydrogenophilus]RAM00885.1 integrase [Desulfobacter hydrogenophilus]
MKNLNHPKKGSHISVEPIRKQKDIKLIKKVLRDSPRNFCLFVLGINTNLRASDLLSIKVHQVRHLQPGEEITLKEKKTHKPRRINLNRVCIEAIQNLLRSQEYTDDDFLFLNNRKNKKALTVSSLSTLVKKWSKDINLKGNYASHSLRKTWGYHQRVTFGVGIPELMVCFNHSSQKQTLDYLCIQPEEIKSVYQNEL